MIPLSRAILRGNMPDPLDSACAFAGCDFSNVSAESKPAMAIRALHQSWPHLGMSVRTWPSIAAKAEELQMIAVPRRYQPIYNRAVHASLYYVITQLHDQFKWRNDQIAALLEGARL